VNAIHLTQGRPRPGIAVTLLVLQLLAGGLIPLAHAGEPETVPAAFDAYHGPGCVVIHDALRCALCHYAATRVLPSHGRSPVGATKPVVRRGRRAPLAPVVDDDHPSNPPRAPPAFATR
jgi:hypothetical protein